MLKPNDIITETELNKLESFGREPDGSYSDRWEFILKPNYDKNNNIVDWGFYFLDEVGDSTDILIKRVATMSQLKEIYEATSNEELL